MTSGATKMTKVESRKLRLSKGDETCFRVDWKGTAKDLRSVEGVTNRLICRPATSVLSLMSSDDPESYMEGISSNSRTMGQTYIHDSCPLN